MRRLEKFAIEGRWWARTSSGTWLRWDHLRNNWVDDPEGPPSLPPDAASSPDTSQSPDPSRRSFDHITSKVQILAIALGAAAYLAFVGDERRLALVAAVACSGSAAMISPKLRRNPYLVVAAIVAAAAGAMWYGVSEGEVGYALRVGLLVGIPMVLLAAGRFGGTRIRLRVERRETDEPAPHTLFQSRPAGPIRHLLAATFVALFAAGALLTLGWDPQTPGFAAFVWLLAYYCARRPSRWLAIASGIGALGGAFSIWFLSALFTLGSGNPPPARSILGAALMFLPGAWIFLSFMASMLEDLPRLARALPRALQRLKPPSTSC